MFLQNTVYVLMGNISISLSSLLASHFPSLGQLIKENVEQYRSKRKL